MGKALPPLPDALKNDGNKVRGCISQVWLVAERSADQPPQLTFRADSDSVIVKGLAAVLLSLYSGKTANEILAIDLPAIFARLKLDQHISPNRRNGFFSMVERIRQFARESQAS